MTLAQKVGGIVHALLFPVLIVGAGIQTYLTIQYQGWYLTFSMAILGMALIIGSWGGITTFFQVGNAYLRHNEKPNMADMWNRAESTAESFMFGTTIICGGITGLVSSLLTMLRG
jgi:hypothetical protein